MALLEETITAVSALLRGETVTLHGRSVHLDGVSLVHPPASPPPILAGVLSPRSLALSGRLAQGTIIPEGFTPAQLPGVLKQIAAPGEHELVAFTYLYIGDDAKEAMREVAVEQAGFLKVDPDDVAMATGTAEEAAERVRELWSAGANTVAVRPIGPNPLSHVRKLLAAL
jgi:alkanesulfonate monooxygenase SsuD/methylene tetrahydromethanopterin reductase-like flavin-dependent oxidoreductase (luciferase family)